MRGMQPISWTARRMPRCDAVWMAFSAAFTALTSTSAQTREFEFMRVKRIRMVLMVTPGSGDREVL